MSVAFMSTKGSTKVISFYCRIINVKLLQKETLLCEICVFKIKVLLGNQSDYYLFLVTYVVIFF